MFETRFNSIYENFTTSALKLFLTLRKTRRLVYVIISVSTFSLQSQTIFNDNHFKKVVLSDSVVNHLISAIQIPTIYNTDSALVIERNFREFHTLLRNIFPTVFTQLQVELFTSGSILVKWPGTSPTLKPIMFMAHQDVVPVDDQESKWLYPPFSGYVDSNYIYGRGTLDDKSSLVGLLEATEFLLLNNYKPNRTIYFGFGCDEEVGGNGAKEMADQLSKKNIHFEYILDEGGSIGIDLINLVTKPIAFVGVAEKGYLSLELNVECESGHSSMPPNNTAIGILSKAISNIEKHPFPTYYNGATKMLFNSISPYMSLSKRFVFNNAWLFSSVIKRKLKVNNSTNALIRTTSAATIFKSGEKENLLPNHASATINFRIIPGESVNMVMEKIKHVVNDGKIKVSAKGNYYNATAVSNQNSFGYEAIVKSCSEIFPEAVVAPFLVIGTTDSRHFSELSDNIFRFVPCVINNSDLSRMHGINERIGIENYKQLIRFYLRMIENSSS